jgi:hypothetical protein
MRPLAPALACALPLLATGTACRTPPELATTLGRVLDRTATDEDLAAWEALLQSRGPNAGPHHEDIFRGVSPDGFEIDLSGAVRLREHAAVPDAVRGPDGAVRLFFVEGDFARGRAVARDRSPFLASHGLVGYGAIDQLVSRDGLAFQTELAFGVKDLVQGMVVDPVVHRLPDGRWRLYYIGLSVEQLTARDAWADGRDHHVYSAMSTDLLRFDQEGLVVDGPNADPAVWCDDGAGATDPGWCLMVSTGLDRSTSTDGGRTFSFHGEMGVPGFAPAFLELPDGRLRLFYNAKESGGPLRSMVSEDRGRSWRPEPGDRVAAYTLEAPSFLARPEGGWWVYYHYWRDGLSGDSWVNGYQFNPKSPRRGPGGTPLPEPPGGFQPPRAP